MEKQKKIMILFTSTGILHGIAANHITNIYGDKTFILVSIALVLYLLTEISERYLDTKGFKELFGPGIWPYITVFYVTWILAMNL